MLAVVLALAIPLAGAKPEKGVAVTSGRTLCADLGAFSSATWWYDWSPHRKSFEGAGSGCATDPVAGGGRGEYVPMISSPSSLDSVNVSYFKNARFLIGYNEPENHNQVKPADGAKAWAQIEQLASDHNLTLVAPCLGNYNHTNDQKWLREWQEECQSLYGRPCKHDHVCTHAYNSGSHAADKLLAMLEQMHNDLKQPIWLNEFAYGLKGPTVDDQLNFMKQILPALDELPYLFRYSWYVSRHIDSDGGYNAKRGSSLLAENTSTLSPLGELYDSFGESWPAVVV